MVITKRECRRRAYETRARGLNKVSQADRSDIDMHEAWALSDAAGIEFLKADQVAEARRRLLVGPMAMARHAVADPDLHVALTRCQHDLIKLARIGWIVR